MPRGRRRRRFSSIASGEWFFTYVGAIGVAAKDADKASGVKKHVFHFMNPSKDPTKELGNAQAREASESLAEVV